MKYRLISYSSILSLLLIWIFLTLVIQVKPIFLPSPLDIIEVISSSYSELAIHMGHTY